MALILFNLGFVIADLYFAYEDSPCVLAEASGLFPLKRWLEVDAYTRIAVIVLSLIMLILVAFKKAFSFLPFAICLMFLYGIFSTIWIIIGAVLFWGKLSPQNVCEGPVNTYMYVLLIFSLFLSLSGCVGNRFRNY